MADSEQGASTSSRRYYKDPLAAAWMMERHGIKLVTPDGKDLCWFEGRVGFWVPYPFEGGIIEGKRLLIESRDHHFIHLDSLHLLMPKVGDMITNLGMIGWRVSRVDGDRAYCFDDRGMTVTARKEEIKIIQRNGVAFHWPESEVA